MIYGSVCSGIEAASVAWHPLGWKASFVSEIDNFPRAVLAHHYPEVPLHGDFTTIQACDYQPINLLVGGTPCQSFSVAGLRGGLADDRGNLALEYLRLADRLRPRWLVWENVPGVLSSNGGRDFGSILGGLGELGYGFAYRVLDAQYFGLAQGRKRVFLVGHLGDWRRAAAVLFERAALDFDCPPRHIEITAACFAPSSFARGFGQQVNWKGVIGTLTKGGSETNPAICCADGVSRYLTPLEWERLQGFPDNYTLIPYRGKPASDGPRKQALGNSMAVPVMRWIGERIQIVDKLPC